MEDILILSTSVNYLDYLSFTYLLNKDLIYKYGLKYTVITDLKDTNTNNFCVNNNINCYRTNSFYFFNNNIAIFNKAGAINNFFQTNPVNLSSWVLLLDADIILNEEIINNFLINPQYDVFYGCARHYYNTYIDYQNDKRLSVEPCKYLGFFQLFNMRYLMQLYQESNYHNHDYKNNLIPSNYNACTYDGLFANIFPNSNKKSLGCVNHIGQPGKNWEGRVTEEWVIDK